ncbi:lactate permease LctP family transporter [Aliiglaciecola sp. LCG003]|uniref:L-lactate permease n=1 Tax=Aliiglaciecola sp. LCG003 TaxID=3053655 RepID=UPI00257231C4|nr:lactate permease LctP family transporter [Aliiglaciecola sp. LCG003]WJG08155.1 lactate permease LctP family transporter [Aliiglaciecola sp. LCG003]
MLLLGFAYLPIVVLIYLMSRKNSLPANQALPFSALLVYLVVLLVFNREPNLVHASVIAGLLKAWTPILIIAGAIFLFRCMEVSGALDIIRSWVNQISINPVAQLMIVAWAFAFLIEGASGFGTPAAIAAPILVSLGFPALRVAVCCLILNSIPVTFGAVGTPIWFGLSVLELFPQQLGDIAWKSALINTAVAPLVVLCALAFVLTDNRLLKQNIVFILLSTFSCTLPYLALSSVSVEFPSLIGGSIGLLLTLLLAKFGIGLSPSAGAPSSSAESQISLRVLCKASFPLWGTVLLLIVTRVPELGLKSLLQLSEPAWHLNLGLLGDFSISAALVLNLQQILQTNTSWQHSVLYVPSVLPFLLIGLITLWTFRQGSLAEVLRHTQSIMHKPVVALMGALVFVNLMMLGAEQSAVSLIGQHLATLSGQYWGFFAPFLGALGSFFSGSATVSNLTFSGIQQSIATGLSLDLTTILALQSVGAAMGNMVCINNIVAVTAILSLQKQEGYILKRTVLVLILYGVLAGLVGLIL